MPQLNFDEEMLQEIRELDGIIFTKDQLADEVSHEINRTIARAVLKTGAVITLNGDYEGGYPVNIDEDDEEIMAKVERAGFTVLDGEYPNLVLPKGTQVEVVRDWYCEPGSADFGAYDIKILELDEVTQLETWGEEENKTTKEFCETLGLDFDDTVGQLLAALNNA